MTQLKGWVIIAENHPKSKENKLFPETFALTRAEAIHKFINGSIKPWAYWYRNYNYRAIKATQTIEPLNNDLDFNI